MIPQTEVRKFVQRLHRENFFEWSENAKRCWDVPQTRITVKLSGQTKYVRDTCDSPGKVLDLAHEIDRISGTDRWVDYPKLPSRWRKIAISLIIRSMSAITEEGIGTSVATSPPRTAEGLTQR